RARGSVVTRASRPQTPRARVRASAPDESSWPGLIGAMARFGRRWRKEIEAGEQFRVRGGRGVDQAFAEATRLLGLRPEPRDGFGPTRVEQRRLWLQLIAAVAALLQPGSSAANRARAREVATLMRAEFELLRAIPNGPEQAWQAFTERFGTEIQTSADALLQSDPATRDTARNLAREMLGREPEIARFAGLGRARMRTLYWNLVDVLANALL